MLAINGGIVKIQRINKTSSQLPTTQSNSPDCCDLQTTDITTCINNDKKLICQMLQAFYFTSLFKRKWICFTDFTENSTVRFSYITDIILSLIVSEVWSTGLIATVFLMQYNTFFLRHRHHSLLFLYSIDLFLATISPDD